MKFSSASLIAGLKLRTESDEQMYQMLAIFLGQFFNTAVMLFLKSTSEPSASVTENTLNVKWYTTCGDVLVNTMYLTAIVPLAEISGQALTSFIIRWADRGFTKNKYSTKLPSIQLYLDIHGGPPFSIASRYSAILL